MKKEVVSLVALARFAYFMRGIHITTLPYWRPRPTSLRWHPKPLRCGRRAHFLMINGRRG